MSMTDIVSGDRTFATYFALLSHFYDSFAMFFRRGDLYNVHLHMASILSANISKFDYSLINEYLDPEDEGAQDGNQE